MKRYEAPTIIEEEINLEDIVLSSYGDTQAGDTLVDVFGNN